MPREPMYSADDILLWSNIANWLAPCKGEPEERKSRGRYRSMEKSADRLRGKP